MPTTVTKFGFSQFVNETPAIAKAIANGILYAAAIVNIALATFTNIPADLKGQIATWSLQICAFVNAICHMFGINVVNPTYTPPTTSGNNASLKSWLIIVVLSLGALKKTHAQVYTPYNWDQHIDEYIVYVDHLPINFLPAVPARKESYYTGFRFFFRHKPDVAHLRTMSGKMGNPPASADTVTWTGFEPIVSVVLEAYSPTTHAWTVLGGAGVGYGHYVWKTASNSSGNWYCQYEISGLVYAGGPLGSTPTPPSSPSAVGAIGIAGSFLNKYITVGYAYDIVGKGPLYTVGSNFSIF